MESPIDKLLPNGALCLAVFYAPNGSGVVVGYNTGAAQPYVTWEFYRNDLTTTSTGHYFEDLTPALLDMQRRVTKYFDWVKEGSDE